MMLVAVAVIGVGLAAAGEVWSFARHREKERELLFVGDQYRRAIRLYYERTPGGGRQYPTKLEDLLRDARYPGVERYLRKLYPDPMTGKSEWGLVKAPDGAIMGVYSLSMAAPAKQSGFRYRDTTFEGATTYQEWRFIYEPPQVADAAAANEAAPQKDQADNTPH
jgi:type II secretory pathway pseudopilin PulG